MTLLYTSMARRYVIHIPPVQHMNGKLAPSAQVVHNQPDTSETEDGYYYGYRHQKRPDISRYALRDKARNLSLNPYTRGEERVKATFTDCVALAIDMLADEATYLRILRAFNQQRKYIRIYNFTIAELVKNNGQSPW